MCSTYYTFDWKPTEYRGIVYRSKLEAHWAEFFTRLGVEFRYEPKGFLIPELLGTPEAIYTPDFGLLSCPYHYLEIKPKYPPENSILKCTSLSRQGVNVALIYGSCRPGEFQVLFFQGGIQIVPRPDWFSFLRGRRDNWADLKRVLGKRKGFIKAMER